MRNYLYAAVPNRMPFIGYQRIGHRHDKMLDNVIPQLLAGLDEPDGYSNPEHLRLPTQKYGYFTKPQPTHPEQDSDQDLYWIELKAAGDLKFAVENLPVRESAIALADQGGTILSYRLSEGKGALHIDTFLQPGFYQLAIEGVPSENSYHFPYTLSVSHTPLALPTTTYTSSVVKGCSPLAVRFQHTGGAPVDAYAWSFPGGTPATSSLANPEVTYTFSGAFAVELAVENRAGSQKRNRANVIQVESLPTAAPSYVATLSTTVKFAPNISGGAPTSYIWTFGDGATSSRSQPTHTYGSPGMYLTRLETSNACGTTTAELTVTLQTSGVDEDQIGLAATLSPNPFSKQLTLKLATASAVPLEVVVYSMTGQRVFASRLSAGQDAYAFAVPDLASGVYTVRVMSEAGVRSWMVVKE